MNYRAGRSLSCEEMASLVTAMENLCENLKDLSETLDNAVFEIQECEVGNWKGLSSEVIEKFKLLR